MSDADIQRVAEAIYEAFKSYPNAFVQGEPGKGVRTTIDGSFSLRGVAKRVIRAAFEGRR